MQRHRRIRRMTSHTGRMRRKGRVANGIGRAVLMLLPAHCFIPDVPMAISHGDNSCGCQACEGYYGIQIAFAANGNIWKLDAKGTVSSSAWNLSIDECIS